MKMQVLKTEVSIPELALVAITRALFGAGVGLVISDRLDSGQRRAVGWTLTGVGILTTVPLLIEVFSHRLRPVSKPQEQADLPASAPYPHDGGKAAAASMPKSPVGSAPYPHGG